ncbi:hypothetical protein O181_071842 [Austropuccinia psidii MF-1]|uniref:Uncharacterized protein n=1 Tax=Austropuccinia psidii MF-1 TaxID=1389203 RepID=A0A9Q3F8E4_9BASI|nr:hypothetical protein [Austropuccinia psidii MF-1]
MVAKKQDWELLPSLWIGEINSYLQVKKLMGQEKTEELLRGWKPTLQGTSPTDKSLVEKPKHVVRGQEEEVGPRKGQQTSGSSPSLHKKKRPQQVLNKDKKTPKRNQKGKAKSKWNKP